MKDDNSRLRCVLILIVPLFLLCFSLHPVVDAVAEKDDPSPPFVETKENTLYFNHCKLDFEWVTNGSQWNCNTEDKSENTLGIPVLKVPDGKYFQVRFIATDPRKFDYSITAGTESEPKKSSLTGDAEGIETNDLSQTRLVMRHSRHFAYYTVTVTLREDLKGTGSKKESSQQELMALENTLRGLPEEQRKGFMKLLEEQKQKKTFHLYSVSFPIWVETTGWELTFSGGMAFSNLKSDQFFIKTDDNGTPDDKNDDLKIVERDPNKGDDFRPDVIALANLTHPRKLKDFGLAFGFGIGDDSDPRYFFGGSYVLGKHFILTGGWTGGQVNALPVGQEAGKISMVGDNLSLRKRFKHGVYLGIAFTFVNRESEFVQKTTVTKRARDDEGQEGKEAPGFSKEVLDTAPGKYKVNGNTLVIKKENNSLFLNKEGTNEAETLIPFSGEEATVKDNPNKKIIFNVENGAVKTITISEGGKSVVVATKQQ